MSFFAMHVSADDTAKRDFTAIPFCSALIALPFLFPIAAGPSVNLWQQLASWLCIAALLLLIKAEHHRPHPTMLAWLAATSALIAILQSSHLGIATWLSAVAVVFATGATAFVGAGLVQERVRLQAALAHGLLWAGAVSAALGLLQYYDLAGFLYPWTTEPGAGQAFGNLRQRNQFASLISMALIAALWLYGRYRSESLPLRLLWVSLVSLLLIAAAASTSRTGLLEILSIVGVAIFIARRERQACRVDPGAVLRLPAPLVLLSWIPLYFVIGWSLPWLAGNGVSSMIQRLSEGAPVGQSRITLWSNVLTLIAERPWTGWGWGELSFAHYTHSTLYPGERFVTILDNAHNLPLHLAVELGIPAAALICGGFLWLVITARPWSEREPFRLMAWGLLGVIVLHSLLEYPLWYGPFQLVFGVCLGVLWPNQNRLDERLACRWRHAIGSASATSLIAISAYVGWDYLRITQIYLPRNERLPAYEENTLEKIQDSWLFANQIGFAELTLTSVTYANAEQVHALAERIMHFSPEPRVIVQLIESAQMSGRKEEAQVKAKQFAVAFPVEYGEWLQKQTP